MLNKVALKDSGEEMIIDLRLIGGQGIFKERTLSWEKGPLTYREWQVLNQKSMTKGKV